MPIMINVRKLRPGMHLATDVVSGFRVTMPLGWQLTAQDIAFLARDDSTPAIAVAMPGLDQRVAFEDNRRDLQISLSSRQTITETFGRLRKLMQSGEAMNDETVLGLQLDVLKTLTYMQNSRPKTAHLSQAGGEVDYLSNLTANVFYLSVLIGDRIYDHIQAERQRSSSVKSAKNPKSLNPLALGAFFKDIAMIGTERVWGQRGKLSQAEVSEIQAHPESGAEMLAEKVPPMVRVVVRSHHENWDGSGYPQGLLAEKINIYARILRVADAYCAATATKAYHQGKSAAAALHEMVYGRYRHCYDPVVARALTEIIQPFPIGACLKLQSGETALVVGHKRCHPFEPTVVIAFDKQGQRTCEETLATPISLSERDDLRIIAASNENLSFLNSDAGEPPDPPSGQDTSRSYDDSFDLAYP